VDVVEALQLAKVGNTYGRRSIVVPTQCHAQFIVMKV
jgi:hypothetical protein